MSFRAGLVAGAGFLFGENARLADFHVHNGAASEVSRHRKLGQEVLSTWTNPGDIDERLNRVAQDEGRSQVAPMNHHSSMQ